MLRLCSIMLNYALYANVCLHYAKFMLNMLRFGNYDLCSRSVIMPKAMLPIITNQIKLDPNMKSLSIFNIGLNPNRSKKPIALRKKSSNY